MLLETKITLSKNPSIWRRVIISEDLTFYDLHYVIQDSMGWQDYHLFEFNVYNPIFGKYEKLGVTDGDLAWDKQLFDASERRVGRIFNLDNNNATYTYDFGDCWTHDIIIERIFPNSPLRKTPLYIGGEGACPPEDSGGLDSYKELKLPYEPNYLKLREPQSRKLDKNVVVQKLWLRKLVQCQHDIKELSNELVSNISPDETVKLYSSIRHGDLRHRNRAIALLSIFKGIPRNLLQNYLFIPLASIHGYVKAYKENGADRLVNKGKRTSKFENPEYAEKLIEILHSPPSQYGYNRTSWRQIDIKEVMHAKGLKISKHNIKSLIEGSGFTYYKARVSLTSKDPAYREKVDVIKGILSNLGPKEKFFSIDEYGPIAIKIRGGKSLSEKGHLKVVPQWQKSKGSLIVTAALELSTNQITHFYSDRKNTQEMFKLLDILLDKYKNNDCLYLSWDAASWHISKELYAHVEALNKKREIAIFKQPRIKLTPLPSGAQFLNVIESVFSGMARAIIHNSDYSSTEDCMLAIDKYISARNVHFIDCPKRAGNKIWGKERVAPEFKESNNCKDPMYR